MTYTPTLLVTTELDAVNACIVAGGEAPVTTFVGQRPDVLAAQQLVRTASREVQSTGWRFNTEHGLEVLPSGTLAWADRDQMTTTLNVFVPPPNLLSFDITNHPLQQGEFYLDTVIRPARIYGSGALVFYDRVFNRDGFPRNAIYIDPVWMWDFDKLPQSAKTLIAIKAKRAYLIEVVQDLASADRLAENESKALASLKREESEVDDFNLFNNYAITQHLGGRMPRLGGVFDFRATKGTL